MWSSLIIENVKEKSRKGEKEKRKKTSRGGRTNGGAPQAVWSQ
jgi:hypothetical protein